MTVVTVASKKFFGPQKPKEEEIEVEGMNITNCGFYCGRCKKTIDRGRIYDIVNKGSVVRCPIGHIMAFYPWNNPD